MRSSSGRCRKSTTINQKKKKQKPKTETKTKRKFIWFFFFVRSLRFRHEDPNTHSIVYVFCELCISFQFIASVKRSIDYFLLQIVIFADFVLWKNKTVRKRVVPVGLPPMVARHDPARCRRCCWALASTIFYRYIVYSIYLFDTIRIMISVHHCLPFKSPHEVFVYVGRFLLSVIAAMLCVCVCAVVVLCRRFAFPFLIVTWSLIFMFSLVATKTKTKKKKTFCVWSSVCLNSETQSDKTKKEQAQTSRWQFICILLFASFVRTELAVQFFRGGSNAMCSYFCICVGISRWIFYHFIVYWMVETRKAREMERERERRRRSTMHGEIDSIVFGRISRIYDIIFSNQKYFSSKLLLYSKFFVCFSFCFSLWPLHVCICGRRSKSCQKNYDPLFLYRTAYISLIWPWKRSFRQFNRTSIHFSSFFFAPFGKRSYTFLIGFHRSTLACDKLLHKLQINNKIFVVYGRFIVWDC